MGPAFTRARGLDAGQTAGRNTKFYNSTMSVFTLGLNHTTAPLDLRGRLNDGIERQLKGKRPLAQMRRGMRRAR